jgi:hypothetical protein
MTAYHLGVQERSSQSTSEKRRQTSLMQPTGQAVIIQDKRLIAKMENKL